MHYKESQLDLIENLPLRGNRASYLQDKVGGLWNTNVYRRDWHTSPERNPWHLSKILLRKYNGKHYDKMFAEWASRCRNGNDLLREYKWILSKDNINRQYNSHYVDENGIVRKTKKHKWKRNSGFPKTFYSNDYKCVYRPKPEYKDLVERHGFDMKQGYPNFGTIWTTLQAEYDTWWKVPEPFRHMCEKVIVSGFEQTFEKSCPEYQKLWYEKHYEQRRAKKAKKKAAKEYQPDFKREEPKPVVKLGNKTIIDAFKALNEIMTNQQS